LHFSQNLHISGEARSCRPVAPRDADFDPNQEGEDVTNTPMNNCHVGAFTHNELAALE